MYANTRNGMGCNDCQCTGLAAAPRCPSVDIPAYEVSEVKIDPEPESNYTWLLWLLGGVILGASNRNTGRERHSHG